MDAFRLTLRLQPVIILYALAAVCSKMASRYLPSCSEASQGILRYIGQCLSSPGLIGFLALMVLLLGAYAVIWQRVIKEGKLSVIYANKASELLWSQLAAVALFSEQIHAMHVAGICIIFTGILLANSEKGSTP